MIILSLHKLSIQLLSSFQGLYKPLEIRSVLPLKIKC